MAAHAQDPAGDAGRGKAAILARGCVACHVIPGVAAPSGNVGPPLKGIGRRAYIAGTLPNTDANMERWLRDPPAVVAGTVMPNMGIGPAEARDIAAYLHGLR